MSDLLPDPTPPQRPDSIFGPHDYSQPPYNTPDDPRPVGYFGDTWETGDCTAQTSRLGPCEHDQSYVLVLYSIGTHDWITIRACKPCTATIRIRHANLGPGRSNAATRYTASARYGPHLLRSVFRDFSCTTTRRSSDGRSR